MRKVTFLFFAIVTACLLQACHSNINSEDYTNDTANDIADTTKGANLIIGKDDIKFITGAASGCLVEIKIGALAKQKGADKRIKNLGAMMVKDLTKGKIRLDKLAKAKKIPLPQAISTEDELAITELAKKPGKEFDTACLNKIKTDYKKALELFQNTAKYGYDPQIKAFAAHNILTIQRHLDLIDAVHASIK